jgi:hypothetical protein
MIAHQMQTTTLQINLSPFHFIEEVETLTNMRPKILQNVLKKDKTPTLQTKIKHREESIHHQGVLTGTINMDKR